MTKYVWSDNLGEIICNKNNKPRETRLDYKALISTIFWLLLSKIYFSEWDECTKDSVSNCVSDFLNLSLLGNSWGNSYTKFVILDIKFHFTCFLSNLNENFVKFQKNITTIDAIAQDTFLPLQTRIFTWKFMWIRQRFILNDIKVRDFFGKNTETKHLCHHDKNYCYFFKSDIPIINLIVGSRNMIKL